MSADTLVQISGGAARIACAVDSAERILSDVGFDRILAIGGVSSGALVNQKMAMNDIHGLRQLCESVNGKKWFMKPSPFKKVLHTLAPLEKKVRRELNPDRFKVPVYVGVDDLEADEYVNVWHDEVNTYDEWVDATLASCAQHFLMHGYDVRVGGKAGTLHRAQDGGGKSLSGRPLLGSEGQWRPDPRLFNLDGSRKYKRIYQIFLSPIRNRRESEPMPRGKVDNGIEALMRFIDNALDLVALRDLAWLKQEARDGVDVTIFSPENPGGSGRSMDASNKAMLWRLNSVSPWMAANPWSP